MDRNKNLYDAAGHLLSAARSLDTVDKEKKELLLNIAGELLDKIVIDDKEINEIEKYQKIIREKISSDRVNNNTSV